MTIDKMSGLLPQLRILGYTSILALHTTNMFYMAWHHSRLKHITDERILGFKDLGNRYFTIWNIFLQIFYIFFALLSDIYVLRNYRKKAQVLPQYVEKVREVVFSSLVWPSSWLVFTMFWGLYHYDRSLIFPDYLDICLPSISNHVLHTMIIPIVFFELVCRPKIESAPHKLNVLIISVYMAVYLLVLVGTFKETNLWLYPIFGMVYDSINFQVTLAVIYVLFVTYYYMQWPLSNILHKKDSKTHMLSKMMKSE